MEKVRIRKVSTIRCKISNQKSEMWIDKKGAPIFVALGDSEDLDVKTSADEGFDSAVKTFMRILNNHNKKKFNDMRKYLNKYYFDISEHVKVVSRMISDF